MEQDALTQQQQQFKVQSDPKLSQQMQPVQSIGELEKPATQILFDFNKSRQEEQQVLGDQNQYQSTLSPGEDEFEENNISEEIHDGRMRSGLRKGKQKSNDLKSNEGSPGQSSSDSKTWYLKDEVSLHKDAYQIVYKYYPPNPILPKTFQVYDDSPRSGSEFSFLKLMKFRGKDFGKSKFEVDRNVNHIDFPDAITLKTLFQPMSESPDDRRTPFGQIVFLRSVLDWSTKNQQPGQKKDEVLEENLLDVKRILKNSTAQGGKQDAQISKKGGLINLQGVESFYKRKDMFDKTLVFESRFESGNLAAALKISDSEYHLLLQNDVNTSGHTQWFFFRTQNTKSYNEVRFNMLNLSKPDSLFNEGMKVLVYSEKLSQEKDIGWHRACHKISYYQNGIRKESQKRYKSYYTLTFTYEFQYDDDTVYFAYCYPYTYTDLLDDLNKISNDPVKSQFCTRKTLCSSLAGNKVEMLTITSKQNLDTLNKRKGVFLTSRVHPGESVGSWMMKGAIEFLTDENSEEAELLRQHFVFKIIPMLNPDGVINGNYRCSLAGCDLNRRWKAPSKVLHPCIYYTKQMLQQFSKERELTVFCDFHGHSRRKNIFMYGCHVPSSPEDTRLYPFILSKICPFFVYSLSRFGNQKSKEATARVAMFNELKVPSIFTMESSFQGNDQGPFANYHFSCDNLMQTGKDFCRVLFLYCHIPLPAQICTNLLQQILSLIDHYKAENELKDVLQKERDFELMSIFSEKIKSLQDSKQEITSKQLKKALLQVLKQTSDMCLEGESTSSAGSDQAPSEDNLEPEEMLMVLPEVDDDAQLRKMKAKQQKKEQISKEDMATSVSPLRRKTIIESSASNYMKRNSTIIKGKQKMSLLRIQQNKDKTAENSSSKVNLKDSRKNTIDENSERKEAEEEETKRNYGKTENNEDDTVTHKKKRKRNVDSRDVWTQTDRSDYMLIKYRQKQKQAMQLAKSQKFTKEEQIFYEQALSYQMQQQMMNKTQELNSTNSSVSQGFKNISKDNQKHGPLNSLHSFQEPGGHHTYKVSANHGIQQKEKNGNSDGNSSSHNFSRNLASSQSNSKGKPKVQPSANPKDNIVAQSNNQYLNPLVKTQPIETIKFGQDHSPNQQLHISQYPYQQFANTQDISFLKNKDKVVDYQSKKLNSVPASKNSKTIPTHGQYQQQYQLNSQSNQYFNQNTLPSISTPNQIITKKKAPQGTLTITKKPNEHPLIYFNRTQEGVQSELSSNHSTQRIIKQNIGGGSNTTTAGHKNSITNNNLNHTQNFTMAAAAVEFQQQKGVVGIGVRGSQQPKSLPPKPQQPTIGNNIQSKILQDSRGSMFQKKHQESSLSRPDNLTEENKGLRDVRILENAYIQQKIMQQHQQTLQLQETLSDETKLEILRLNQGPIMEHQDFHQERFNSQHNRSSLNPQVQSTSKGNFFQNTLVEDDNATIIGGIQKKGKRKSSEAFPQGNNTNNANNINNLSQNLGSQAQSHPNSAMQNNQIKKMIESSWKAVQQQHLSQTFYQDQNPSPNVGYTQYGQYSMTSKQSAVSQQRRKIKDHQDQQQQRLAQSQQQQHNHFINVQSILPHHMISAAGASSSSQQHQQSHHPNVGSHGGKGAGVKISIVNVHNQFNIHNNIIINNNGNGSNGNFGSQGYSGGMIVSNSQGKQSQQNSQGGQISKHHVKKK